MKRFCISLLLVCTLWLTSCIAEWGPRDCAGTFTIYFEYLDGTDEDPLALFSYHITGVDLFFYDEQDRFVMRTTLTRQQLQNGVVGNRRRPDGMPRPGIILTGQHFNPGDRYRVVAWANAYRSDRKDFFNYTGHINQARIGLIDGANTGVAKHFAPGTLFPEMPQPFEFIFPDWLEDEERIMRFSRANIEIRVGIRGASDDVAIDITGVHSRMDFNKQVDEAAGTIQFRQIASRSTERSATTRNTGNLDDVVWTSFFVPVFEYDTGKEIALSMGGSVITNGNIVLSEFIEDFDVELLDTYVPEMVIPILIDLEEDVEPGVDRVVNIQVLRWEPTPVPPILW